MKNTFLIILLMMMSNVMKAQQTATHRTEEYCMVLATQKFMSLKLTVAVDYGQPRNIWKNTSERDSTTGKVATFESVVDALNYMNERGWEFVNAYAVTTSGQNVYHYLMRRKIVY